MRLASFSSVSRFRYPLKSRPKPLHAYSAIRYFPLRSRSMVRINTEVCSRITLKSSKGCATLEPNQSARLDNPHNDFRHPVSCNISIIKLIDWIRQFPNRVGGLVCIQMNDIERIRFFVQRYFHVSLINLPFKPVFFPA